MSEEVRAVRVEWNEFVPDRPEPPAARPFELPDFQEAQAEESASPQAAGGPASAAPPGQSRRSPPPPAEAANGVILGSPEPVDVDNGVVLAPPVGEESLDGGDSLVTELEEAVSALAPLDTYEGTRIAGLRVRWRDFSAFRQTEDDPKPEPVQFGLWVVIDDLASLLRMVMEDESQRGERRMPYFGIVWPSAESLVKRLLTSPSLKGKTVLDLGCGLGLCGFTAAAMGARVTFFDWEPRAIAIVKATAAAQEWPDARFNYIVGDWRRPPQHLGSFDLILGADLLYEQSSPDAVAMFLARHLKPGAEAWVTDPGRPQAWPFIGRALDQGLELLRREWLAPTRVQPDIALLRMRRPFFGARSGIRGRI
jgi:2-polyprenyl-3-methyl-5-hydroxy-6-metoxy-1,4-benzoquinol methylase